MTNLGKNILKNAYEISDMYFRFLNLGYFFDTYAKQHYLANKLHDNIDIRLEHGTGYILKFEFIKGMLEDIYNNKKSMSVFTYLALFNTLRGTAGAIREAFGEGKEKDISPDHKEIRLLFMSEFFNNNQDKFKEFDGIVRLIRNVLSHNITDRVEIQEKDFDRQKSHWIKEESGRDMRFEYSYTSSPMMIEGYSATCAICLKWDSIKPGVFFNELVTPFQCFMLIEFCRNALYYLNEKYK